MDPWTALRSSLYSLIFPPLILWKFSKLVTPLFPSKLTILTKNIRMRSRRLVGGLFSIASIEYHEPWLGDIAEE